MLQTLTVADAMQPVTRFAATARLRADRDATSDAGSVSGTDWENLAGTVTDTRRPQELFGEEALEQALRQLTLYGQAGLPVLSADREHLQGWITRQNVLEALSQSVQTSEESIEHGAVAADFGVDDPSLAARRPSTPLTGYEIVEITVGPDSSALGRRVDEIAWPPGCLVVAVTAERELVALDGDSVVSSGERVILLVPTSTAPTQQREPISVLPS